MAFSSEKAKIVSKWLIRPILIFALGSFLILGFNLVIQAKGMSKSNLPRITASNINQTPTPTPTPLTKYVLGATAKAVLTQTPTETKIPEAQTQTSTQTKTTTQTSTQTQVSTQISTSTPTSTPTPSQVQTLIQNTSIGDYLLGKVNEYRASLGLSIVQSDSNTCDFAKKRAGEISTNFNHDGFSNLPYSSYSKVTENIAQNGNYTDVINQWINSSVHAQNMREDTPYVCIQAYGDYYAYEGWKP